MPELPGINNSLLIELSLKGTIGIQSSSRTGLSLIETLNSTEVESNAGMVIMNQAFQATRVETTESKPFKPINVDIDESMISNLLILSPPKNLNSTETQEERKAVADVLSIDFLEIDILNEDLLANKVDADFEELDVDYLAQDFLSDILDHINKVLAESFLSQLTDVFVKKAQKTGQDSATGIIIIDQGTFWEFRREDTNSYVRLRLSKSVNILLIYHKVIS